MATMSISTPTEDGAAARRDPDLPSLLFDNRTGFDALHFDTIDQHGAAFHVIVARTGYALGPCDERGEATLRPLAEPARLVLEDRHHDDNPAASVRQESDLAPYKPLCDVIVNGAAYAPKGRAAPRFSVALRVERPGRTATVPAQAQGPAPPSAEAHTVLIDKTLTVTGERLLRKRSFPVRVVKRNPWSLTPPEPALRVPMRYEFAEGGQCRIEAGDQAAAQVPKQHRLSEEQRAQHPDKGAAPVAHDACDSNPLGRGFASRWYLKAADIKEGTAPCIEAPAAPFSANRFWEAAGGETALEPAGLGVVGRGWLPRRTLVGRIETKAQWGQDEVPNLAKDFDFRYWNAAPADQQCEHLAGQERFTLLNLCVPDAPFARVDAQGNTVLRFSLPRQSLFILAASQDAKVSALPMAIDTVLIDPEDGRVDLVWRVCLLADGELVEARLLQATEAEQLERLAALQSVPEQETAAIGSHPPSTSSV